jgi:hypothetical protein
MRVLGLPWPTLQLALASIGRHPVTRGLGGTACMWSMHSSCSVVCSRTCIHYWMESSCEYTPAISSPNNPCKPHSAPPGETTSTGVSLSAARAPSMKVGAGDRHWNHTQQLLLAAAVFLFDAWSCSPIVSQYGWFNKRPRGGKRSFLWSRCIHSPNPPSVFSDVAGGCDGRSIGQMW